MAFHISNFSKSSAAYVGCAGYQPDRAHRLTLACVRRDTLVETVDGPVAAADLTRARGFGRKMSARCLYCAWRGSGRIRIFWGKRRICARCALRLMR